jgi:hypothetical protein
VVTGDALRQWVGLDQSPFAEGSFAGGPAPLGLHLLGKSTPEKVQNMIDNISKGPHCARIDRFYGPMMAEVR